MSSYRFQPSILAFIAVLAITAPANAFPGGSSKAAPVTTAAAAEAAAQGTSSSAPSSTSATSTFSTSVGTNDVGQGALAAPTSTDTQDTTTSLTTGGTDGGQGSASATVSPTTTINIGVGVANPSGSPQQVAAANAQKCAGSFVSSGAPDFLNDFLTSNGTSDWLVHMQTLLGGPNTDNGLDCKEIPTNSCPVPESACGTFDHAEFFFIQKSASNANSFLNQAREALQDNAIINGFNVDQIVADFIHPEVAPLDKSVFLKLSTAFALASGIASVIPGADAAVAGLGILGALFGIQDAFQPDPPESDEVSDIETALNSYVSGTFSNSTTTLVNFNNALFGGSADFDLSQMTGILREINGSTFTQDLAVGAPDSQLNPIAQFFAPGFFDAEQNTDVIQNGLKNGVQLMKQQMAGLVIEAGSFFIWIDNENDCGAAGGANGRNNGRFLNGQCARLVQTDGSENGASTQDPPPDIEGKLDDGTSGYNIDPTDMFANSIACSGSSNTQSLDGALESGFPHCFFSLVVIQGAGDPCDGNACAIVNADDGGITVSCPNYPSYLEATCGAKLDRNYPNHST